MIRRVGPLLLCILGALVGEAFDVPYWPVLAVVGLLGGALTGKALRRAQRAAQHVDRIIGASTCDFCGETATGSVRLWQADRGGRWRARDRYVHHCGAHLGAAIERLKR